MSSAALVAVVAVWLLAPAVITARSLQQAGASITGRVIDGASGQGLSDARVQIQLAARDASQPPAVSPGAVLTGLDGRFTLTGLPPGRHVLIVSVVGYRAEAQ